MAVVSVVQQVDVFGHHESLGQHVQRDGGVKPVLFDWTSDRLDWSVDNLVLSASQSISIVFNATNSQV